MPDNIDKTIILFVDDEESILEVAKEFFQHKGYRVVTAANGVEAIEAIKTHKIDCCFTDINMPEMDGLELAEKIRNLDNTIPVVVMTGYPSLENTIRTLKNGVVDFLIKPVNLSQLEICVKRVMRERTLFIENILLKKELEHKARLEKLNQELLYKVEELDTLNKIMSGVSSIGNNPYLYDGIVGMTIALTRANDARLYIINEEERRPFLVAATTSGNDSMNSGEGPPENDTAIEQLVMEIVTDEIPLLISENSGLRGLSSDISSFMSVPLKIQEKVFGVLIAAIHKGIHRFVEKDLYYLSFLSANAAYAIENLALYEHINRGLVTTLKAFVKAIEARDPYTEQHSSRVTEIAVCIGREVGCSEEEIDILNIAGPLHDIGKIGIRDDILLKPGPLTSEEFQKIMEHPVIGADIVGQLGMWDEHQRIIKHHHEYFDGRGYPDGLKGEEIPKLARIVAVADAYDAMASDRAYRKRMPATDVLKILQEGAGSQFDPQFVTVFINLFENGRINSSTTFRQGPD